MVETRNGTKTWWDGLKPDQRVTCWSLLFGLVGMTLVVFTIFGAPLLWSSISADPLTRGWVTIVGCGVAILLSAVGSGIGWLIEDRHQAERGGW